MQTALPVRDLVNHMNCNRMQAELLVRAGIIPRIIDDPDRARGAMKLVAKADADAFLARLLGAARKVDQPSECMTDIVTAAGISRWPVVDIVSGILVGRFAQVECADPDLRFKGVLVDLEEIREVLGRLASSDHVGVHEAAQILDVTTSCISTLAKLHDPSNAPYLREMATENTKGVRTRIYSKTELLAFRDRHLSLSDIATRQGLAPRWMKVRLDNLGVKPIASPKALGRLYYRRADLGDLDRS